MEAYYNPATKKVEFYINDNWYRVKKFGYVHLNNEQYNFYKLHPNASIEEILKCELDPVPVPPRTLEDAKREKIDGINTYDVSDSVNGFYYDGNLMWLDKNTRAALKNTIESLSLLGRDSLNIWYKDLCITIPITSAMMMLSALEVYATDCYNVTAQHKTEVKQLTTIEEVDNYDVEVGYPEKLIFTL